MGPQLSLVGQLRVFGPLSRSVSLAEYFDAALSAYLSTGVDRFLQRTHESLGFLSQDVSIEH